VKSKNSSWRPCQGGVRALSESQELDLISGAHVGQLVVSRWSLLAAAQQIRASSCPEAERFIRENLVAAPTAEEAADVFERMATRDADGSAGREG
jgi:hypothetical protein